MALLEFNILHGLVDLIHKQASNTQAVHQDETVKVKSHGGVRDGKVVMLVQHDCMCEETRSGSLQAGFEPGFPRAPFH